MRIKKVISDDQKMPYVPQGYVHMNGFTAGIVSIATLLVGAAIVTTLVKNSSGTTGIITASTSGFASLLNAAQGNSSV